MEQVLTYLSGVVGWIVGESLVPGEVFSLSRWLVAPATIIMVGVIALEYFYPAERREWNRQHLLTAQHFLLAGKVSVFTFLTAPAMQWLWIRYELPSLHLDRVMSPWAFMALTLAVYSFIDYWAHRILHEVPLLWHIHKVHHAPSQLVWASTFQEHFAMTITSAPLLSVSTLLLGTQLMPPWGSVYILVNYLQHANIQFKFGWLNYVFALPEIHRYHHERDRRYFDTNFSGGIMLWDHVFGTFWYDPEKPAKEFGIAEPIPLSWTQQQWLPLVHIAGDIRRYLRGEPRTYPSPAKVE